MGLPSRWEQRVEIIVPPHTAHFGQARGKAPLLSLIVAVPPLSPHHAHHHHQASRIECRPHQWVSAVVGCLVLMATGVPHGGATKGGCARGHEQLGVKAAVVTALDHSSGQCSKRKFYYVLVPYLFYIVFSSDSVLCHLVHLSHS